jgi:hypothetical protein
MGVSLSCSKLCKLTWEFQKFCSFLEGREEGRKQASKQASKQEEEEAAVAAAAVHKVKLPSTAEKFVFSIM